MKLSPQKDNSSPLVISREIFRALDAEHAAKAGILLSQGLLIITSQGDLRAGS